MSIEFHEMRPEEAAGKGFVHCQSWKESYRGIVDDDYLDRRITLERCREIAVRWPQNTVVAVDDGRVVGFGCWCPCRDEDASPNTGELQALYLLDEYKGRGIGRALLDFCMDKLAQYDKAVLWVLAENERAIGFYRHCGFHPDGGEQWLTLGTPVRCVRMAKKI